MTRKMPTLADWIAAMRSGQYPQTRGRLTRTESSQFKDDTGSMMPAGFCCLGVLADVINPNGWLPPCGGGQAWQIKKDEVKQDGFLPYDVWIEFLKQNKFDASLFDQDKLATINDDGGSFSKIIKQLKAWEKQSIANTKKATA